LWRNWLVVSYLLAIFSGFYFCDFKKIVNDTNAFSERNVTFGRIFENNLDIRVKQGAVDSPDMLCGYRNE
jgi:hypothetical protein